jgi:FkbM family methyltransferase
MPGAPLLLSAGIRRAGRHLFTIAVVGAFPGRVAVLRAYLPMLAKELVALARPARRRRAGWTTLFGHTVAYADYGSLVYGFEELFVEQQYAFEAATDAPLVLDCGANIGLSVLYFKLRYPAARITAFEPSPEAFPLLQENVGALPGVTLEQKALARAEGELPFYAFPDERASLRATTVARAGAKTIATVAAAPLSAYVEERVDLLKLDVEGSELDVMEELAESGALRRIERMLIEAHHLEALPENRLSSLLRLLEDNGFAYRVRTRPEEGAWSSTPQDVLLSVWRAA